MLINEKVILRPIEYKDIENLNKWKNDEEVFKYLGGGYMPTSIDQQKKWLDSMIDNSGNNKRFIIQTIEGKAIGFIGLYDINIIHRTCSLGIYIGEKEALGKGYAKQACILIEEFAKLGLNLRKISLDVVSCNEKAINMYKSLGYVECGKMKEERYIDGRYEDLSKMEKFI